MLTRLVPRASTLLLGSALLLTSACQIDSVAGVDNDTGTAPIAESRVKDETTDANGVTTSVFTVVPSKDVSVEFGGKHALKIPKNTICDLNSSYGPTEWDKPCALETDPVTITAKSRYDSDGRPHVDFQPKLRFAPSDKQDRWVLLTLYDDKDIKKLGQLVILYCDALNKCVDESASDNTQNTKKDVVNNVFFRRIKHFSGYNVAARNAREDY